MGRMDRKEVFRRARERCEYCHLPQSCSILPHEIDHIRSKKHHGGTTPLNVCVACAYCNSAKGSNVAGYDPDTGQLVGLFNPRADSWKEHFFWRNGLLVGRTPRARATIDVLSINEPTRLATRRWLIKAGLFSVD